MRVTRGQALPWVVLVAGLVSALSGWWWVMSVSLLVYVLIDAHLNTRTHRNSNSTSEL